MKQAKCINQKIRGTYTLDEGHTFMLIAPNEATDEQVEAILKEVLDYGSRLSSRALKLAILDGFEYEPELKALAKLCMLDYDQCVHRDNRLTITQ